MLLPLLEQQNRDQARLEEVVAAVVQHLPDWKVVKEKHDEENYHRVVVNAVCGVMKIAFMWVYPKPTSVPTRILVGAEGWPTYKTVGGWLCNARPYTDSEYEQLPPSAVLEHLRNQNWTVQFRADRNAATVAKDITLRLLNVYAEAYTIMERYAVEVQKEVDAQLEFKKDGVIVDFGLNDGFTEDANTTPWLPAWHRYPERDCFQIGVEARLSDRSVNIKLSRVKRDSVFYRRLAQLIRDCVCDDKKKEAPE